MEKKKRLFWVVYINFYKQKKQVIFETDKPTELLSESVAYNHSQFKPLSKLEIVSIKEIVN
jgi:hypothetical protein